MTHKHKILVKVELVSLLVRLENLTSQFWKALVVTTLIERINSESLHLGPGMPSLFEHSVYSSHRNLNAPCLFNFALFTAHLSGGGQPYIGGCG